MEINIEKLLKVRPNFLSLSLAISTMKKNQWWLDLQSVNIPLQKNLLKENHYTELVNIRLRMKNHQ